MSADAELCTGCAEVESVTEELADEKGGKCRCRPNQGLTEERNPRRSLKVLHYREHDLLEEVWLHVVDCPSTKVMEMGCAAEQFLVKRKQ